MIVFGGTTEGKKITDVLEELACPYFYSTKTKAKPLDLKWGKPIQGALDREAMQAFIQKHNIRLILNGSHPFASDLHKTIAEVASSLNIPVLRLERSYPERLIYPLMHYVDSYPEALKVLEDLEIERLLALTGVQTIPHFRSFWSLKTCWFRILNTPLSRQIALKAGFNPEFIIQENPVNDKEHEKELILQTWAQAVVSKETGESGFFMAKRDAALEMKVPFIVIKRPPLPASFEFFFSETELRNRVITFLETEVEGCEEK